MKTRSRWGVPVAIVCALTFLPLLQDVEAVPITVEQIFCEEDKRVACSVLSGGTEASLLEMSAMDVLRIELPGTSSPPGGAASVNLPTGAASPVPFPFSGESMRDAAKPIFRDEGTSGAGRALQ